MVVPINIAFSLVFQVILGLMYWQEYDGFYGHPDWVTFFTIGVFLSVTSALYPSIAKSLEKTISGSSAISIKNNIDVLFSPRILDSSV